MWNIRNSTEDHRGREGKLKGEKSEMETNHERLWALGNKQGFRRKRGGEWAYQVMGIKEGMCWDEHRLLYATNESLNTTS